MQVAARRVCGQFVQFVSFPRVNIPFSRSCCNVTEEKKWEVTIGIEVHAQLKTKHKLLSHTSLQQEIPVGEKKTIEKNTLDGSNEFIKFEEIKQEHRMADPNTVVGLCDSGMPGALPTINYEAVEQICRTGKALGGSVQPMSRFDRKHYSYPDLPNSYQITQQFHPLVIGGSVKLSQEDFETLGPDFDPSIAPASKNTEVVGDRKLKRIQEQRRKENEKRDRLGITSMENVYMPPMPTKDAPKEVNITRIHLEHDSGKSIHDMDPHHSFIDLNRSGVALMEIVSEPEIQSSLEAALYVRKLQIILSHIQTAHTSMDIGSMRCDLNISVRPMGTKALGVRSEIKNLSSIKHLKAACDAEIRRHVETLTKGNRIYQETRGFDFDTQTTFTQRRKETEVDYRFMPDPDLPVLLLEKEEMESMLRNIPLHPDLLREKYKSEFGIPVDKAMTLVNMPDAACFFNEIMSENQKRDANLVSNWVVVELFGLLAKERIKLNHSPVSTLQVGSIVDMIQSAEISGKIGKKVLRVMFNEEESRKAQEIVKEKGWIVQNDTGAILTACDTLLSSKAELVTEYHNGDERTQQRLLKFFMGEIMKISKGKFHPQATKDIMASLLSESKKKE